MKQTSVITDNFAPTSSKRLAWVSFEGIYEWIAFLPSKVDPSSLVLNRYLGVFRDGKIKISGIEARRGDTPMLLAECQKEMLEASAGAATVKGVRKSIPQALQIVSKYVAAVRVGYVDGKDWMITKRLSKSPVNMLTNHFKLMLQRCLTQKGFK
jgi:DNA polymerase-2